MIGKNRIKELIDSREITILPYNEVQLGTNSYDVRIGSSIYRQADNRDHESIHPYNEPSVRDSWKLERYGNGSFLYIDAGEFILAHTIETIGTVSPYVATMHARSSIGRLGLTVCSCAGLGDIGYHGQWTMEIRNFSRRPIMIPVGMRVAQMAFHYVDGASPSDDYTQRGKYSSAPDLRSSLDSGQGIIDKMIPRPWEDWDAFKR
jgi:dCTP deaminase